MRLSAIRIKPPVNGKPAWLEGVIEQAGAFAVCATGAHQSDGSLVVAPVYGRTDEEMQDAIRRSVRMSFRLRGMSFAAQPKANIKRVRRKA